MAFTSLLLTASRQPIFKWILILYFWLELLPNGVIRWTAEAKELINGQIIRVLILHVRMK